MNVAEANRERVKRRWDRVHTQEIEFMGCKQLTKSPLKARLHAYLCGDGSVSMRPERQNGKMHYDVRFYPDDFSLIKPFKEAMEKIYGKHPAVRKDRNHYRVFITSKTIAMDLVEDSMFASTAWSIPAWIMSNKPALREWLRAFFDAEAYVGAREIRVQTVNERGAGEIRAALRKFGIATRHYEYSRKQPHWNTNFHIVIGKVRERKRFLNNIGLNHIPKLRKLKGSLRNAK